MNKHIFFLLAIILFIISSCSKNDYELNQSVFIEDTENPELPIYSEWGYNTFGVYIDRKPFVSKNYELPSKIIISHDTLNLYFMGEMGYEKVSLIFSFPGYAVNEYTDLIILNNDTINLTDSNCKVTFTEKGITTKLTPKNGYFIFNKVQNLYVDNTLSKAIISGYFRFQTEYYNEYITFDAGRFDLGIGYDNFYNF